ncbi:MAG: hypothetical protein ACP5M5_13995 [Acidibrevibacterium sp.]|uniref:hypothetical protein n=1 Tax=Acidibrevibacterium sp. TaxID=2606776 RepID=UPI003D06663F
MTAGSAATVSALFAHGHIVDVILVVMACEALALIGWRQRTGRGLAPAALLAMLLPGGCLLLALRAALRNAGAAEIALWLLAALITHLVDLSRRWRG